jgi:hypothetical protein
MNARFFVPKCVLKIGKSFAKEGSFSEIKNYPTKVCAQPVIQHLARAD